MRIDETSWACDTDGHKSKVSIIASKVHMEIEIEIQKQIANLIFSHQAPALSLGAVARVP